MILNGPFPITETERAEYIAGGERAHAAGVSVEWLRDARSKRFSGERDSVKLMTYKSSKGLQFPVVVVAGVGSLPWRDPAGDARELYVAMTRATERLLITASRASEFVRRLQPLCRPLAVAGV